MEIHRIISFIICAVISFALTQSDYNKNHIMIGGEPYLPVRFRWRASLGDVFGICAGLILLRLFRVWVG